MTFVAACLEAATGQAIGTLLDEHVIDPLGLPDTLLFDDSLPEVEVVNAYKDLDLDGVEDAMGTRPLPGLVTPAWTAGGMISTTQDLVRFLAALLAGEFLTDASRGALLDEASGGAGYALGIYRANGRWGHDGGIAGFLSAAFHDPSTGVTVAVLTNRFGPDAPQAVPWPRCLPRSPTASSRTEIASQFAPPLLALDARAQEERPTACGCGPPLLPAHPDRSVR
jgi:D-alanyl-D-alanine carboxypeptidase